MLEHNASRETLHCHCLLFFALNSEQLILQIAFFRGEMFVLHSLVEAHAMAGLGWIEPSTLSLQVFFLFYTEAPKQHNRVKCEGANHKNTEKLLFTANNANAHRMEF